MTVGLSAVQFKTPLYSYTRSNGEMFEMKHCPAGEKQSFLKWQNYAIFITFNDVGKQRKVKLLWYVIDRTDGLLGNLTKM